MGTPEPDPTSSTVSETPEPTGSETPEPTGSETPEPTGSETPEPTGSGPDSTNSGSLVSYT